MIAALTTSLPETPGGERNWDYRYTWIRDATFTLWACTCSASTRRPTTSPASSATSATSTATELQIMYGIGGERELTESTLDHLSGYGGAQPVRIGNGAFDQQQNDVYGALVDSLYIHSQADRPDRPSRLADHRRPGRGARRRSGASPTRGSGRRAARPSTTSPRS